MKDVIFIILIFGDPVDVPKVPYQKVEFIQGKHAP